MSVRIRLARGGTKKRPHYNVVVADSRSPRDGRFIEKVGTYDPLLPETAEKRITLNTERINHWLGLGALPTDRVLRFLAAAGIRERTPRVNPERAKPGKKAEERAKAKAGITDAAPAAG